MRYALRLSAVAFCAALAWMAFYAAKSVTTELLNAAKRMA